MKVCRNLLSTMVTTDQGDLVRRNVVTKWNEDVLNIDHLMHDNWVRPIQRVKLTKAIASHTFFETKILRSDTFAQVNLISAAPTLQNLRIGLRKRESGKSKVPAKQRESWPKVY